MIARALVLGLTLLGVVGCGDRYVRGTDIEYTTERQELADLVERYRVAVEQRDTDALRALASRRYYENGSTTTDPSDDYDYRGLEQVFIDVQNMVKAVKYEIELQAIEVLGERATVDYAYRSQYLLTLGEQDKWATAADKNRLSFLREDGQWRIVSGM